MFANSTIYAKHALLTTRIDDHMTQKELLSLRIFVDNSLVEVYANNRTVIATHIYPTFSDSTGLGYIVGGQAFSNVSANLIIYTVTFVSCVENSTCPQGNPAAYSATFALNGTLSPNITLNVGDQLQFNLDTTVSIHPLTICQNSAIPNFCKAAATSDELNTPITNAGDTTSVVFNTSGTYYYGCHNHPGMGAMINVIQTVTTASSSSSTGSLSTSTKGTGARHQLSVLFLFAVIVSLFTIIFT
ncbi:unnamed protein product [Adineta steineri]|nr:unnamed protein product [Adineta steineri]